MKSFKLTNDKNDNNVSLNQMGAVATIFMMIVLFWIFYGGGLELFSKESSRNLYTDYAESTIEEYNITKKGTDQTQVCIKAGSVASGFLFAKNESKYLEWSKIEKEECERAGLR